MAVLSSADRQTVYNRIVDVLCDTRATVTGITKSDLRAAVDAVDAWADANTTSFNSAIPQPARNNLTAQQKALLLAYVVLRRQEVS